MRSALDTQLAWRSSRAARRMQKLVVHLLMSSGPKSLLIPSQDTPPAWMGVGADLAGTNLEWLSGASQKLSASGIASNSWAPLAYR